MFNGMIMGTEEQLKTLATSIQEKTSQYSDVMSTAGKEARRSAQHYISWDVQAQFFHLRMSPDSAGALRKGSGSTAQDESRRRI